MIGKMPGLEKSFEGREKYWELLCKTLIKNLEKRGFKAWYAKDADEAKKIIGGLIPRNAKVGVGGSLTLRELGIVQFLRERGNVVYDHWAAKDKDEEFKLRELEVLDSDYFLTSANAVSLTGAIVIVDAFGNRIAPVAFGKAKAIIVVGRNKIVRTLEEALARAWDVATVMNALRLGVTHECMDSGKCHDMETGSYINISRLTLIIERPPLAKELHVVVVNKDLGY